MAQMTVEAGVTPDGVFTLDVVSDDFPSIADFHERADGLKYALRNIDESMSDGTDIHVLQAFDNLRKGGPVDVRIKRFDGTSVPAD